MPQRPPNINGIVMPINFNFLDFQPMVVQMIVRRFCLHISLHLTTNCTIHPHINQYAAEGFSRSLIDLASDLDTKNGSTEGT